MNWEASWKDIIAGGAKRWKDGEEEGLAALSSYLESKGILTADTQIFIPLVGDHLFAAYAYKKGHSFTATEMVKAAAERVMANCGGEWSSEKKAENIELWSTSDGRARIWLGDHFAAATLETKQFDLVVDKDAFGAVPETTRPDYLAIIKKLLKPNGHVLLEGKTKEESERSKGPPFHLHSQLITEVWQSFEILECREHVYTMHNPSWEPIQFLLKFNSSQ